jgi:glyoxylase-like metal-dependent hydrolase (beta-lactamase superfamily II)
MAKIASAGMDRRSSSSYEARNKIYLDSRKNLSVDHAVTDAEEFGRARVIYAPGHSPDELCLAFDGVVFTGDHVLPEITPHPTMKATYRNHVKDGIPSEYRDASGSFGLERYMRSLKTILDLGPEYSILPAHRLYNRNKFNLTGVERAEEVIRHHARRMSQILQRIGDTPTGLESITRAIFERGKLVGGNLYMALSEMVAHVELLFDLGDLGLDDERQLVRTGHENYRQFVSELTG